MGFQSQQQQRNCCWGCTDYPPPQRNEKGLGWGGVGWVCGCWVRHTLHVVKPSIRASVKRCDFPPTLQMVPRPYSPIYIVSIDQGACQKCNRFFGVSLRYCGPRYFEAIRGRLLLACCACSAPQAPSTPPAPVHRHTHTRVRTHTHTHTHWTCQTESDKALHANVLVRPTRQSKSSHDHRCEAPLCRWRESMTHRHEDSVALLQKTV